MPNVIRDRATVVIDISDGRVIKAGFAGDDNPRGVFSSILRGARSPVKNGAVVDWNHLEEGLRHAFDKVLRVGAGDHPLVITDAPISPKVNRERLTQLAFKSLKVKSFTVINGAVAALRASKRSSGVAMLIGEGDSFAAPVHNGKPQRSAMVRGSVAGRDLTEYLQGTLVERQLPVQGASKTPVVHKIRESLGYVALDYDEELWKIQQTGGIDKNYKLPDGQIITVGAERFRCPEVLFKPNFIGLEQDGIHKLTFQSIMKCDVDIRRDLYRNVVMSGGSTMFTGIAERMQKEIKQLAPDSMTIKIIAPPNRAHTVWIGGSILSSLSTFEEMWISKNEYDESGPGIVHRKCT